MKTIQVTIKSVYGNDLVYPVCDTAKKLVELAGRKTFTDWDIKLIKELGYKFETVSARSV